MNMAKKLLNIFLVNFPYLYLHPRFPKEFVLESVKVILENNNLNFDNEYFNQIKGMAMGTIFAPTHAILTIEFFELTIFVELNLGEHVGNFIFKKLELFSQ